MAELTVRERAAYDNQSALLAIARAAAAALGESGPRRHNGAMQSRHRKKRGVAPWLLPSEYAAHHVLDPTLPASFEEWEASAMIAAGTAYRTRRVVIKVGEFSRWCADKRRRPDSAARLAFARRVAP